MFNIPHFTKCYDIKTNFSSYLFLFPYLCSILFNIYIAERFNGFKPSKTSKQNDQLNFNLQQFPTLADLQKISSML